MGNIKEIAKARKSENGNEKISTKELLWYIVTRFDEFEKRVSRVESIQKVVLIVVPIIVSIVLFIK